MSDVLHPRFTNYHLLALLLLSLLQYILNEIEVEAKTELWMKQNEEYLREQKGKQKGEEELSTCAFINTNRFDVRGMLTRELLSHRDKKKNQ